MKVLIDVQHNDDLGEAPAVEEEFFNLHEVVDFIYEEVRGDAVMPPSDYSGTTIKVEFK